MVPLAGVHPQTASFGPERRFRFFEHAVQFFKPDGATFFSAILNIAHAMPAVSKLLKPCSESKSTVCGRTLSTPKNEIASCHGDWRLIIKR
jgi:hypothetical protein